MSPQERTGLQDGDRRRFLGQNRTCIPPLPSHPSIPSLHPIPPLGRYPTKTRPRESGALTVSVTLRSRLGRGGRLTTVFLRIPP